MPTSLTACPHCAKLGRVAYHVTAPCPNASRSATGGWQDAIDAMQVRDVSELAPKIAYAPAPRDGWERALNEASRLAPGRLGSLLWIDARCAASPNMFSLDPWWIGAFERYYASGKLVMVCRKGLRAGGSASACRALVRAALFTQRDLDAGTIGVIPIMSSTRDEATDRFVTFRAILRALGVAPSRGGDDESSVVSPGGIGGEYVSTRSQAGGGVIRVDDSQGHKLEFRILPALVRHSVGYTGVAGFADESDLWLNDPAVHANPAAVIFKRIGERFTTQPEAEFLIFSASYYAESAHSVVVDAGDTPLQFVARLGEAGAALDEESRWRLASALKSTDPRLLAKGDPSSPDIPAWVANPTKSPIERCYQISGDISSMLGLYGGRVAENKPRGGAGADMAAQCALAAEINHRLAVRFGSRKPAQAQSEVMKLPGAKPGDIRYAGPTNGPRRLGGDSWRTRKVM